MKSLLTRSRYLLEVKHFFFQLETYLFKEVRLIQRLKLCHLYNTIKIKTKSL